MNPLSRSSVGQTFKQETFVIEDPNNMQDICYYARLEIYSSSAQW